MERETIQKEIEPPFEQVMLYNYISYIQAAEMRFQNVILPNQQRLQKEIFDWPMAR